jgi:hypothetical protein
LLLLWLLLLLLLLRHFRLDRLRLDLLERRLPLLDFRLDFEWLDFLLFLELFREDPPP